MTPVATKLLKDLEAMSVAELQVEDDAIVVVDERQGPRLLASRSSVHSIRFVAQHTRDELQYRLIIIDYENAHPVLVEVYPTGDDYDDGPLTKNGRELSPPPACDSIPAV